MNETRKPAAKETTTAKKTTPAKKTAAAKKAATAKTYDGFTEDERSAMKERGRELKAQAGRGGSTDDAEAEVLAKIAELPEPDRTMAQRLHAIVQANAPELTPRLWYGMPAYAKSGKVLLFFQNAQKFKARYATLGFSDEANLDEGTMWPTSYALTTLTADDEARIGALVRQAAS